MGLIWLKFFHVLALVLFVGGDLFLSRTIAYAKKESNEFKTTLARYLVRAHTFLVIPALVIALGTGMALASKMEYFANMGEQAWLHMKLALVAVMIVVDAIFAGKLRKVAAGEVPEKFAIFNALHGINGLCFILILYAVVIYRVRPFVEA